MPERLAITSIPPPSFGERPHAADWQDPYPVTLGMLFVALSEHVPDGIDAVNTYFDYGLDERQVKGLYEDLVMAGACEDPKALLSGSLTEDELRHHNEAFSTFLEQTAYSPVYDAEKVTTPTLEEYSRVYVLGSVQAAPTETGMQIGAPGKVVTTGKNRFNPRSPEGFTVEREAINPNTNEQETIEEQVELASFFYWDAEPTVEELLEMDQFSDVIEVLDTFASLAERFGGCIPNWNNKAVRRSQKPLFFRMVEHAASAMPDRADEILARYLRPMMLHLNFLRDGMDDQLGETPGSTYRRTGRLPDGEAALHGSDDFHDHKQPGNPIENCGPRIEMARYDVSKLREYEALMRVTLSVEERCDFFLGYKVSAEGSLDHSLDQAEDPDNHNGRFIGQRLIDPALNAIYAQGLLTAAKAWEASARVANNPSYTLEAQEQVALLKAEHERIKQVLLKYNYNPEDNMFGMYDFVKAAKEGNIDAGRRRAWSLNGVFVLTSLDLEPEIASEVLDGIDQNYLRKGGLLAASRYFESDEQWDGKASWPILVRECVKAAIKYKRYDLAAKWLKIHIKSNETLFKREGKLAEKNDASRRGYALTIGEYSEVEVNDLTMSHSSHLWMKRTLPRVRRQRVVQYALGWMRHMISARTTPPPRRIPLQRQTQTTTAGNR